MWTRECEKQLSLLQLRSLSASWNPMNPPPANPSSSAPLSKPRSLSIKGLDTSCNWAVRYRQNLCQRISLGSDCDEAQICTCVVSSHGFVVQVFCKASCVDSVILLDEVDKTGQSDLHGGPSTALLEVLDLEQNWNFDYDYINISTYLSQDLFIYTASFLNTISSLLLDQYEIVHLAGFLFDEKVVIANRVLVPNPIGMDGLKRH